VPRLAARSVRAHLAGAIHGCHGLEEVDLQGSTALQHASFKGCRKLQVVGGLGRLVVLPHETQLERGTGRQRAVGVGKFGSLQTLDLSAGCCGQSELPERWGSWALCRR
jgi:hypothetical protein